MPEHFSGRGSTEHQRIYLIRMKTAVGFIGAVKNVVGATTWRCNMRVRNRTKCTNRRRRGSSNAHTKAKTESTKDKSAKRNIEPLSLISQIYQMFVKKTILDYGRKPKTIFGVGPKAHGATNYIGRGPQACNYIWHGP